MAIGESYENETADLEAELAQLRLERNQCDAEMRRLRAELAELNRELDVEVPRLRAENERLTAALKLHHEIANRDRASGDDKLWTPQYEAACEATSEALATTIASSREE